MKKEFDLPGRKILDKFFSNYSCTTVRKGSLQHKKGENLKSSTMGLEPSTFVFELFTLDTDNLRVNSTSDSHPNHFATGKPQLLSD